MLRGRCVVKKKTSEKVLDLDEVVKAVFVCTLRTGRIFVLGTNARTVRTPSPTRGRNRPEGVGLRWVGHGTSMDHIPIPLDNSLSSQGMRRDDK
jgi:hypothetical protein